MIPAADLWLFVLACLVLVLTPGPNMIYLISRSITQGKKAGMISLSGVILGFIFHILMVSFGLTAIFMAIPYAYFTLKMMGVAYLLYLAYQAVKPSGKNFFEARTDLQHDKPWKLFTMGLLTNVLNPKAAMFYLSFFPQFIKPAQGSVLAQALELGAIQMCVSFTVNALIIFSAAKMAGFFKRKPGWVRVQKWFMASVLTGMAVKMAFTKAK
ncbi:LysE family translocator [Pseudoflavitalea sp. G-6-1-2]|uniref:LysE family translocator n=1 Tax=Pseudoflavitalea sp. G-6-1-2 TaxID=2728841 RepID=UPI00146ADEA1|nr:LysE family translocator [Pseudoflavitalea sp. G-6-1-2]NML23875.1 LysE family translocator [Pseudoflavitalea sp. G-6-1-2]